MIKYTDSKGTERYLNPNMIEFIEKASTDRNIVVYGSGNTIEVDDKVMKKILSEGRKSNVKEKAEI